MYQLQNKKEAGQITLKKVEMDENNKKKSTSTETAAISEKVTLRKVERPSASPKPAASPVCSFTLFLVMHSVLIRNLDRPHNLLAT